MQNFQVCTNAFNEAIANFDFSVTEKYKKFTEDTEKRLNEVSFKQSFNQSNE